MSIVRILCSGSLVRGALAAFTLLAATGCGQRGPLYLPNDPAAAGRATLPQILTPGSTNVPTPSTSTMPTNPTLPATPDSSPGGQGTGTAAPVGPR